MTNVKANEKNVFKKYNPISLLIILLFVPFMQNCNDSSIGRNTSLRAGKPLKEEFAERRLCIVCHEEQYRKWSGSHHDLAMDAATEETVKGDFNNAEFTTHGVTSTFYRNNGKFFIRTDGPDGRLRDYEISYVFGVDPLQQYMIKFPDGRIQLPDIGWNDNPEDEGGQRWIHLHPDMKITPGHIFHWTRRFLNWNYMCGECHTTNFKKNYDLRTNTFNTTWSEPDVGCQACHGPGTKHVEWARSIEKQDSKISRFEDTGLEVNLGAEDHRVQVEACARCHSRRGGLSSDYEYGRPFMDNYVPQILIEPFYYPDGQIMDEVYVYGSFIQSKKYHQEVRCTDCHDHHTAKLHVNGNDLCIQCHASSPSHQYDSVTLKDYDTPEHHFHKQGTPGAQCVECHMPETTYMIVDPRRDHKFQIPRPDLSVSLDIPNPCNRCHTDKSAHWAADRMNNWYPELKQKRERETLTASAFTAGQTGDPGAEKDLISIAKDSTVPAITRATALHILSRYRSEDAVHTTTGAVEDNNPLVRYEAVRGISSLIPETAGADEQQKKYAAIAPLLRDPVRAVRTEAARALTEVPAGLFKKNHMSDFSNALDEYIERQESIADRPEAHLNLGLMYENLKEYDMAEGSYKTSLRLVNDFMPARFNLANFYNSIGRNREAEEQFREIIDMEPENGEAHYSLGLLLAEMNRLDEAVDALDRASELLPDRARVRYNYALTLRHLGRNSDALSEMTHAYEIDREDPEIVHALTVFCIQEKKWEQALTFAQRLVELAPDAPGPEQMVRHIRQKMR